MTVEVKSVEKHPSEDGYFIHFRDSSSFYFRSVEHIRRDSVSFKPLCDDYSTDTDIKAALAEIVKQFDAGDSLETITKENENQPYTRPETIREVKPTRG